MAKKAKKSTKKRLKRHTVEYAVAIRDDETASGFTIVAGSWSDEKPWNKKTALRELELRELDLRVSGRDSDENFLLVKVTTEIVSSRK